MQIDRRVLMKAISTGLVGTLPLARYATAQTNGETVPRPFRFEDVVAEAEARSRSPFQPSGATVPGRYADLSFDQYRSIWFKPEAAIWADQPTDFRLDLFHAGFIYNEPVTISLVREGFATELVFSSDLFEYGYLEEPPATDDGGGIAGFRARYPINSPEAHQEFFLFLGAAYFRGVARGQVYGLSARGLAIDTAEPGGEEFPAFREFWIEQPAQGQDTLVVYALLDSVSVAGAYRFDITPGAETVTEVHAELFFRRGDRKVGIAPLTSMFQFGGMNRSGFEDYRRAVHDSDGLQILTGKGEWLWRPLANPASLQISGFADLRPQGFGLMQRSRDYDDFLDAEAKYERRPSLWIEPIGDWGEGAVELVEIPTETEFNDNIVAYWRPASPPNDDSHWSVAYRMRWTNDVIPAPDLLFVAGSYAGRTLNGERLLFVVDFGFARDRMDIVTADLAVVVSASEGEISNGIVHAGQPSGAVRVSFELDPGGAEMSELHLLLKRADQPASETWLYRWTSA